MAQGRQAPSSTGEVQQPTATPSDTKPPIRATVAWGVLLLTIITIIVVTAVFLLILGYYGWTRLTDSLTTQTLAILSAVFGVVAGLIGTYFGVKTASDAKAGAEALAASNESRSESEAIARAAQQQVDLDIPHQIRLLAELRESGTISDEEFRKKNMELLNRTSRKEHKEPGAT